MRHDDEPVPSLEACIAALAEDSGAPDAFVGKIRALFQAKGIALDRGAGPYLRALREAFRREETLRRVSDHSRAAVDRAREDLGRLDRQWESQLAQLRSLQQRLQRRAGALRERVESLRALEDDDAPGERRVMSPGSVELPFVPGPDAIQ